MDEWTLSGELAKRGMSIQQACVACNMDMPTMTILVNGGFTLPQMALRVCKALGLTKEQGKRLGKALDARIWCRPDNGLARPKKINMDPYWYDAIDGVSTRGAQDRADEMWLDCGKCAEWLWQNGKSLGVMCNRSGVWINNVNEIVGSRTREREIKKALEKIGVPKETALTSEDLSLVRTEVYFTISESLAKTFVACADYKNGTISQMIDAYMAHENCTVRKSANNAVRFLAEKIKHGEKMTFQQVEHIGHIMALDMRQHATLHAESKRRNIKSKPISKRRPRDE